MNFQAEWIDRTVGEWRRRMAPQDPQIRGAILNDPYQAAHLEHIRRMAHVYDQAMRLAGIDYETRRRVLSMVLLGDPSGLENLAALRVEKLYKDALLGMPVRFPEARKENGNGSRTDDRIDH